MIGFTVKEWAAWAPGLTERDAWRAWSRAPWRPAGDDTPALPEVPAMQRRRIERLGRMAIQTACWCRRAEDEDVPLVFASRHGDVARSMELLDALSTQQPLSPTTFGLSVHNAIAALYSIVQGERGNYLAVAGGRATAETACVEAAGLIADGAGEAMLVMYDAPLPEVYRGFADEPDAGYAWCWRLGGPQGQGARLRLDWEAGQDGATAGDLPHGLEVLRFLLSGDAGLARCIDGTQWRWHRDV